MNTRLIVLGLATKSDDCGTEMPAAMFWLLDQLLALIANLPIESEAIGTEEFRSRLGQCRAQLAAAAAAADGEPPVTAVRECLELCREFSARGFSFFHEREAELVHITEVLKGVLADINQGNMAFQDRVTASTQRINKLVDVQDIRELRRQLSLEAHELQRAVSDKKKRDESSFGRLTGKLRSLRAELAEAKAAAALDALTGVANRRSFDETIRHWTADSKRSGRPFILAFIDIDNFKHYNDTYGHQVGDQVLRWAAAFLSSNVRQSDFLARYGGGEFVLLMQDIQLDQAKTKLSDLLAQIANSTFECMIGERALRLNFTVSSGMAQYSPPHENLTDLSARADKALYEAKRRGKNRVVVF